MVNRGKTDTVAAVLCRVDGRLHGIDKGIGRRLVVASRNNELDRSGTFPRTVGLAPADARQCLGDFDILPAVEAVGLILKAVEVSSYIGFHLQIAENAMHGKGDVHGLFSGLKLEAVYCGDSVVLQ